MDSLGKNKKEKKSEKKEQNKGHPVT